MSAVIVGLQPRQERSRSTDPVVETGASNIIDVLVTDQRNAMEEAAIAVSVVVPTYRRPEMLYRCLQALLDQDLDADRYEIIVCDDGPDAQTYELVSTLAQSRDSAQCPRLRYVAVTDTQGPAAARNRGWRLANGSIVAFTDDDTIPSRSWLRRGLVAMQGGAIASSGRIAIDLPDKPTDYERDAAGLARSEFVTANCFVKRAALELIGGFDERFTSAWREDSDLQFSLMCLGRIERAPDAVVKHPVRPERWGVSLRQQRKAVFEALLYKKHPELYRRRIHPGPRYDYYFIVLSLLIAVLSLVAHRPAEAVVAGVLWAALTGRFCVSRLEGTTLALSHVSEMVVTSILIPVVATYWRLVGAWRYRVWFL